MNRLFIGVILFVLVGVGCTLKNCSWSRLDNLPAIVKDVQPSVVTIQTSGYKGALSPDGPSGSGFIISNTGYIVTNADVIDKAVVIFVILYDGTMHNGILIGSDKSADVALIKIDAGFLQPVRIGDAFTLEAGQPVFAIGEPMGFQRTVTSGIISRAVVWIQGEPEPYIQDDVAINPGNSGGLLFNLNGEVVGMNNMIYSTSGGSMGLSFAIPIDIVIASARVMFLKDTKKREKADK